MVAGGTLRVVSYNLHSQRDDQDALIELIRGLAPDVLVLQEAPRRFGWRYRCAELARRCQLVVASGGQPALGNLILTDLRVRVRQTWVRRFPLTPGRHLRGAAFAVCEVAGTRFVTVGSHLSVDSVERGAQAGLLATELAGLAYPVVLGVDVNDEPGSEAWKRLGDGLIDPAVNPAVDPAVGSATDPAGPGGEPTFSTAHPRRRIDALWVDPRLPVRRFERVDTPLARRASDHFPILAELELPAG